MTAPGWAPVSKPAAELAAGSVLNSITILDIPENVVVFGNRSAYLFGIAEFNTVMVWNWLKRSCVPIARIFAC